MPYGSNLHFFEKGVKPVWEDPQLADGARFSFKSQTTDRIYCRSCAGFRSEMAFAQAKTFGPRKSRVHAQTHPPQFISTGEAMVETKGEVKEEDAAEK